MLEKEAYSIQEGDDLPASIMWDAHFGCENRLDKFLFIVSIEGQLLCTIITVWVYICISNAYNILNTWVKCDVADIWWAGLLIFTEPEASENKSEISCYIILIECNKWFIIC